MTLNRGINKLMEDRAGTKLYIRVSSGIGKYPWGTGARTNIVLSNGMFTYDKHQLPYYNLVKRTN